VSLSSIAHQGHWRARFGNFRRQFLNTFELRPLLQRSLSNEGFLGALGHTYDDVPADIRCLGQQREIFVGKLRVRLMTLAWNELI
jgi:hypothetical protein